MADGFDRQFFGTPAPAGAEATGGEAVVQVGGVQMNEQMYSQRSTEIRSDYASALGDINAQFANLAGEIGNIQNGISEQISDNKKQANASYQRIVGDMRKMVTNIQHAQNMQVTQSASQLDAMVASGQFGGNVYRSQQVYAMNMSSIITTSMAAVSDITLQYRMAAEQLQSQYSAQQLQAYVSGAGVVLSAMSDLAKTYAMVRSDLTVNKNNQINAVLQLKVQQDIANAEMQTNRDISSMQIEAQKLMTQWNIDASMNETLLKIELEDRRIASTELIAERNNTIARELALMQDTLSRDLQEYDAELQREMQKIEIEFRETSQDKDLDFKEKQLRLQEEMGILQMNFQYAQLQSQAASQAAAQRAQSQQMAIAQDQFNRQFDLQLIEADYSARLHEAELVQQGKINTWLDTMQTGATVTTQQGEAFVADAAKQVRSHSDFEALQIPEGHGAGIASDGTVITI